MFKTLGGCYGLTCVPSKSERRNRNPQLLRRWLCADMGSLMWKRSSSAALIPPHPSGAQGAQVKRQRGARGVRAGGGGRETELPAPDRGRPASRTDRPLWAQPPRLHCFVPAAQAD